MYSVLVPARLDSTRLPQKLLRSDTGQALLCHSLCNLSSLRDEAELWLVTDSPRLAELGEKWVDGVHLSTKAFASGSERIAEALPKIKGDWILNVQADEPEIDPRVLRSFMKRMMASDEAMGTLGAPMLDESLWQNPNAVKVITDRSGRALYFSRAPIPHGASLPMEGLFHHVGVYAYRRSLLQSWAGLTRGSFEQSEGLEQLRALENDQYIYVHSISEAHKGIDTLEDYLAFVQRFQNGSHGSIIRD